MIEYHELYSKMEEIRNEVMSVKLQTASELNKVTSKVDIIKAQSTMVLWVGGSLSSIIISMFCWQYNHDFEDQKRAFEQIIELKQDYSLLEQKMRLRDNT